MALTPVLALLVASCTTAPKPSIGHMSRSNVVARVTVTPLADEQIRLQAVVYQLGKGRHEVGNADWTVSRTVDTTGLVVDEAQLHFDVARSDEQSTVTATLLVEEEESPTRLEFVLPKPPGA